MELVLVTLPADRSESVIRLTDGRRRKIKKGEAVLVDPRVGLELCFLSAFRSCVRLTEAAKALEVEPDKVTHSGPLTILKPGKGVAILKSDLESQLKKGKKK